MESFPTETAENIQESPRKKIGSIAEKLGKKKGALLFLLLNTALLAGCDADQRNRFVKFAQSPDGDIGILTGKTKLHASESFSLPNPISESGFFRTESPYAGTERNEPQIEFENIENFYPGMSVEDVRRLCTECLPHNIGIHKLSYVNQDEGMPESYGMSNSHAAASADRRGDITFYRGSHRESIHRFIQTFFHESSHVLEFHLGSSKQQLQMKLNERVASYGRFRSRYVEEISNPNRAVENQLKTTEYFAEISAAYLQGSALPQEDVEIVHDAIASVDPSFDVEKARRIAAEIEQRSGGGQHGQSQVRRPASGGFPQFTQPQSNQPFQYTNPPGVASAPPPVREWHPPVPPHVRPIQPVPRQPHMTNPPGAQQHHRR